MQIRERKTAYWALLAAVAKREAATPRPPGLHLSTIVDDYYATLYPELRYDNETSLGLRELFWEFGNAWEATLAAGLSEIDRSFIKPDPVKVDGVWCSPDGFGCARRVHEMKLTWTSVRDGASHPKVKKYFGQGMGYCYAMASTSLSVHVGYVRGNYRETLVDLKTYCPVLTARDVEKHWTKLMRHAEDRGMR